MLALNQFPESKKSLLGQLTQDLEPNALNWLSGYFAGLAEKAPAGLSVPHVAAVAAPAANAVKRLTIVYGSQTGNARRIAETLAERANAQGLVTQLVRAESYPTRDLKTEQLLYIVMSTQGDGDPPDDSMGFVEFLSSKRAPKLPQLKYAVLGLGDSSYPSFCGISHKLDARLAELGAERLQTAGAADLDIETVATPWLEQALEHAQKAFKQTDVPTASVTELHPAKNAKVTREQPFHAELLQNQALTGRGSSKDIRHIEISLEGSQLSYKPGDSLGIWPTQSDALVQAVIATLKLDAGEKIEIANASRSVSEWLSKYRELTQLTKPFLVAHAELGNSDELKRILQPEQHEEFKQLLATNQLLDVLKRYPAPWTALDLIKTLRPLTPRLYSIASSQSAVDEEVHLTLANVSYVHDGEERWGVASSFVSGLNEGDKLPIFIEENTRFRLPSDPARDVIMIGPGTGIAPFRAFVQERGATEASGRNWLFFGNPHFHSDFLYQTEWQGALRNGHLNRLDLAFSRDQENKVYVQDKLLERATDLYDWIQSGAHVYVCGDATHMAKDVHQTLLRIAQTEGGLDAEQSKAWLDDLAAQGRYARDVY